eukprot:TRINITY_DN1543_c0_g9_i1.p1 TRINITY_DN1543_c0_g9~~TRINITY_DN1543_c0_g9_i1.p1  ORF type:complete len:251 (+),score=81.97 TRINITY_DN1543_c0_g9_i1:457-1209(+)
MVAKEEELSSTKAKVTDQEAEIKMLGEKLKEFESLSENLEILEETRRRAEDLRVENERLKDVAEQANSLQAAVETLNQQKDALVKEFTALKSNAFEEEQKLLKTEDSVREEAKEHTVIEEIRGMLLDGMMLCKTLDTLAREGLTACREKFNKASECVKFLPEYMKTADKQERLNLVKALCDSFPFLSYIPKKSSYLGFIDECVINTLKAKEVKISLYEALVAKYGEIEKVAARKCLEFELKLSCYNLSES